MLGLPDNPATTPGPHQPDWMTFLRWLVYEHDLSADDLLDAVEKPTKYQREWRDFITDRALAT